MLPSDEARGLLLLVVGLPPGVWEPSGERTDDDLALSLAGRGGLDGNEGVRTSVSVEIAQDDGQRRGLAKLARALIGIDVIGGDPVHCGPV